ncbi:MAG: Stp1/IreP family PP2C-type Ser/Thr phosphatase [Ruminococcaceae bacterium]|nr:Stp1/IreP family PP2C-type Ser/Thr phosphatase [Oscillospiraceae bacterium]
MLRWGGCTDVGQTRPINEDGYYISDYSSKFDAIYAIVADGMGGHRAGEIASGLALGLVSEAVNRRFFAQMNAQGLKELLAEAVREANRMIYEKSVSEIGCDGMGTTITLCLVFGNYAMIAHVGDSRAYMLRGGALHQITTDHSLVQELLRKGQITPEEAEKHPQKNVITRALGTDTDVDIDIYEFSVCSGDCILLCSDGLSNMLSDNEIKEALMHEKEKSENALAEGLIDLANQKGGYDNITAVILKKD